MHLLILGLVLFFAAHSMKITGGLRQSLIGRMGSTPYKAAYSIISFAGLLLIGFGFAGYRSEGLMPVWYPPFWTSHLALLLNWIASILVIAAYLPCHIRKVLKHPMLTGIMVWATAHLLANGDLGGMILFGAFLLWAIIIRVHARSRPGTGEPVKAFWFYDMVALTVGTAYYAAIVFWLHPDIFNMPVWPG